MDINSIFAVDLDGTLLRSDGSFSRSDLNSLERIREAGCSVVLATGRSPFSLWRCLEGKVLPVDWYVLSSGAGIMNSQGTIRLSHTFSNRETLEVHAAFESIGISDVSIQGPFPDAHMLHWMPGDHGDDFNRRLEIYRGFSHRVDSADMESSELIGFAEPDKAHGLIKDLEQLLGPDYSIIRATSPIDHSTTWIEVFPRGVNKGSACEFIRRDLSIEKKFTGAIGNDWNDIHMLEWAGTAFVVGNAPDELTGRFMPVASNDNEGVSAAVTIWMGIVA